MERWVPPIWDPTAWAAWASPRIYTRPMSLHSCPFETSTGNKAARRPAGLYRVGRITVDQIFSTSRHISPALTFQPISGTGPFVIGLADTGWGAAGAWYPTKRVGVIGAVHDADSNRQDFVTPEEISLQRSSLAARSLRRPRRRATRSSPCGIRTGPATGNRSTGVWAPRAGDSC